MMGVRVGVRAIVALLMAASVRAAERPNILWLSCEDLSPRLGCYGDATVPTPNIDRLAAEGVRFDRAFTATGVCAPCRFTIITGLYPMQAGAQYMRTVSRSSATDDSLDPALLARARARPLYEATPRAGVRCFSEYLREAGYYCTNNSKEDYQFRAPVTAWDDSSNKAHYKNRAPGQPFFAVFNNTVTHESGVHGEGRSPRRTDPAGVAVPSFLPDTPAVRTDIARHYDNIVELDAWVGRKMEELRDEGLLGSTIVMFFSDHGDGLPRHKRWVYDSGTRVPLIVRFPNSDGAGTVDSSLMSFIDLAPTTLALAGVDRPDYLPGRVFVGAQSEASPDQVFMHRDRMDDTCFDTIRSARGERYRYVRNYRPEAPYLQPIGYRDRAATMGEVYRVLEQGEASPAMWQWASDSKPREELYDTLEDPDHVVNLADDPAHDEQRQRLSRALDAWIASTGDPLATDEIEVLRTRVWPPSGEQPSTAKPELRILSAENQPTRIAIDCATEGASVGYRTGGGAWTVYTGPFETDAARIEAVAHRIGWKPSRGMLRIDR